MKTCKLWGYNGEDESFENFFDDEKAFYCIPCYKKGVESCVDDEELEEFIESFGEIVDEIIREANDKYNIPKGAISSCCRNKRKVAKGLHWMYYEDYLSSSEEYIMKLINNNPISHCIKVMNITTNDIYSSIQEASDITGICRNQISKCCRGIGNTAGGYKWKYIKEAV